MHDRQARKLNFGKANRTVDYKHELNDPVK